MGMRIDALLVILGSIIFQVGAFTPVSITVFSRSDGSRRLAAIEARRRSWRFSQVFFALGPIVVAAGVGLAVSRLPGALVRWLALAAFAALAVGAGPWIWHVYRRAVDPRAFVTGSIPAWLFTVYSLLTQVGLALFGLALLGAGIPPWVGSMLLGAAAVLMIVFLLRRDIPPFIYYVLTLINGVLMVLMA